MASDQTPRPANAAEALERLGTLSLREWSIESLLQTVADLAKDGGARQPRDVGVTPGQRQAQDGLTYAANWADA